MNKLACPVCRANGFVHPTQVDPHGFPFQVRCTLCIDCPECFGKGIMEPNQYYLDLNSAQKAIPWIPQPRTSLYTTSNSTLSFNYSMASIHPHLKGMMKNVQDSIGKQEFKNRLHHIGSTITIPVSPVLVHAQHHKEQREQQQAILLQSAKKSIQPRTISKCPKCLGKKWFHSQQFVHDKKRKEKCKHCIDCKLCFASGVLVDKRVCLDCKGLFFAF